MHPIGRPRYKYVTNFLTKILVQTNYLVIFAYLTVTPGFPDIVFIMKQLTKAEEDIMQILWDLSEANVASIVDQFPEPKPAYNTVSTIVRILESKSIARVKYKLVFRLAPNPTFELVRIFLLCLG